MNSDISIDLILVILVIAGAFLVCFRMAWRAVSRKGSGPCGTSSCGCAVGNRPKIVKNR
jgi:hypothetical protein